jgi:hypothetical protein
LHHIAARNVFRRVEEMRDEAARMRQSLTEHVDDR